MQNKGLWSYYFLQVLLDDKVFAFSLKALLSDGGTVFSDEQ